MNPILPLRWLYVDLNSYFASVEQQEWPELRGKPVAVVPSLGVATTSCLAASYEAKALALKIKATLAKKVGAYVKSSIGIAPNKYLAKVASDIQKPDGLTVLEHHQLPHALYH